MSTLDFNTQYELGRLYLGKELTRYENEMVEASKKANGKCR